MLHDKITLDGMLDLVDIEARLELLLPALSALADVPRAMACIGVWNQFDALRCLDQPFNRARFMHYLEQTKSWAERQEDPLRVAAQSAAQDNIERYTGTLYGSCWVEYDHAEFADTARFLELRFRNNGIDPSVLQGLECLDAGCGGGRFSIAMYQMGAASVVGVDVGQDGVCDAERRRDAMNIDPDAVSFEVQSLLSLPETWSNRFGFICSNGVLHHTTDPPRALAEVSRVLAPGRSAYIYVYGSGGLHWQLVSWIRRVLDGINREQVQDLLHLLDVPAGKRFHIMDHWFVPRWETVSRDEFEQRLTHVGFTDLRYMPRGLYLYDSSERRFRYPEDSDLMGEGDLRYLVRKPFY